MDTFSKLLTKDTVYHRLLKALEENKSPQLLVGLSAVHKAHFIYSLTENLNRTAHVVMPDEASAYRMCGDINSFLGYEGAQFFPTREFTFRDVEGVSQEYEQIRLGILGRILADQLPIVVSSVEGALLHTIPPEEYIQHTHILKTGSRYPLEEVVEMLVTAGYQRGDQVDGVSQFALRGGILDVFSPGHESPYRVEFWGDEIDTIAPFDLLSQRRGDMVDEIPVTPVREALISNPEGLAKKLSALEKTLQGKYGKRGKEHIERDIIRLENGEGLVSGDRYLPVLYDTPATIFNYCTDRLLFVSEHVNVKENSINFQWQLDEDIKILLEEGVLFQKNHTFTNDFTDILQEINSRTTVVMDTFTRSVEDLKLAGLHHMKVVQLSPWSGDYDVLEEDLEEFVSQGYRTVIFGGSEKSAKIIQSDLTALGYSVQLEGDLTALKKGSMAVLAGTLSSGMKYPELGLAILTHGKAAAPTKRRRRHKSGKKLRALTDLKIGDHVVHSSHGIGVFQGISKRQIQGVTKDYIQIRYAGTDALFVPVTQLDLVSKYVGAPEGSKVRLNRLNSVEWQKTRSRVKGAVKEMAKELTVLYAKRVKTKGFAFSPDTDWQKNFEEHFPFEETEDQLISTEEIKKDMERPIPMDRLLCGDVGFGKTEVALRAVFKCAMDSKQCAVLVPTTILAWQHFQTFMSRLDGFPIRVELLSRFRTPKEQKDILKRLGQGEIDVVIGTHRIVQKDVLFKDLGLCVIDEEQRFGVAHKERFKELRASVDVLTLSATPIPRTLNMALSGIRDMSLIEEPPQDRYPVQTYVMEHEEDIIYQAIQKEMRRGGQVFYLHNNTSTIHRVAAKLQDALPTVRVTVAHGRMGEERLSEIWRQLMEHEIDVLVCTTIIETGVDVPNANTLIIENADNYGLSQLYQIRGRVGRSTRRAYAYLTFQKGKAISDIAAKRLTAIREFTTFGSGFQIAMRDLEIRGAGNILGGEQHGHMESVGYDMYVRLLEEAVKEESGEEVIPRVETAIDIELDAYIPESYISNTNQRIDAYKRISSIDNKEDSMDVTDELIDRYGEPPTAVLGLIDVALVRGTASRVGITDIQQRGQRMLYFPAHLDMNFTGYIVGALGRQVLVNAGEHPYYAVTLPKDISPLKNIQNTLEIMGKYLEKEES